MRHVPSYTFLIVRQKQIDRISNIFDNAGQVIFGLSVVSPLISGFDKINAVVVVLGGFGVLFCWCMSIWLSSQKGKK